MEVTEDIVIEVPPGANHGAHYVYHGKADEIPGAEVGDAVIIIQER